MKYYSPVERDAFDIMDTLFNGWNRAGETGADWSAFPRYKARRTDEGLEAAFELPGVEPEKVSLSVEGDLLKVSGEHTELGKEEVVRFERTLRVPDDLDAARMEANLKNGMLSVRIPKIKKLEPKRIEIAVK